MSNRSEIVKLSTAKHKKLWYRENSFREEVEMFHLKSDQPWNWIPQKIDKLNFSIAKLNSVKISSHNAILLSSRVNILRYA